MSPVVAQTPVVSPPQHSETTTTTTCQEIKPKIQDFKVQIHDSTILLPIQETETKPYFLSNLDQDFNFPVPTVHLFSANPDFPFETVIERLKTAVQKVLVSYECYAGRVRQNHQSGRLEIDCNGAGVGFAVASSEFSLDEIGDVVYPNPGNRQLVFESLDNFGPNNDQPLCIFQVTSFKCGGFSLGFTVNHLCCDANGCGMFLNNVASQAFEDKPLAIIPFHDRHLLAARSPPRVEFPHPELILTPFNQSDHDSTTPVEEAELVSKIFKLSLNQINYLKDRAKPTSSSTSETKPVKITSFNVVAALIWRCKALSSIDLENDSDKDTVCTMNTAVDVRSRLNLPPSYSGNAVIYAYASSKCIEFEEKPFCEIVRVISDGIAGLTDEYVRSTVDWYELNKGRPNQGYFISAWWRVGFEQIGYPWGKPICCLPVRVNNVCLVLPPDQSNDKGMNLVVTLPPKEMDKFQALFYEFLLN